MRRSRTALAGAALVLVVLACAGSSGTASEILWRELVASHRCAAAATAALASWSAEPAVLRAPPPTANGERYRIPTREIGVWVLLDLGARMAPVLTRVRAEGAERLTFDEDCSPEKLVARDVRLPSGEGAFTDGDLREALDSGHSTVVYVWSPHMSLSVDGYTEIAEACAALGLELVPVLFPGGDRDFARREAARAGIPPAGLEESAALELLLRDAHVHAPSIVVFDGERVSPVLPGYRNAAGYRRFLEGFLTS